jgi:hypothetical protein
MPGTTLRDLGESSAPLRLGLCALALSGLLYAQSQRQAVGPKAQSTSNEALIRLVTVDRFAFGGIGYSQSQSAGEADYETIFSRPSALAEFETIYLVGNPEATAYALFGIHELNLDRYLELARPLRNSHERVLTQSGCLVSVEAVETIIRHIDSGLYSLVKGTSQLRVVRDPSLAIAAARSPAAESRWCPRQSCTASRPGRTSLPDSP